MWADAVAIGSGPALLALAWLWHWARKRRLRIHIRSKHARFYTSFRPSGPESDSPDAPPKDDAP